MRTGVMIRTKRTSAALIAAMALLAACGGDDVTDEAAQLADEAAEQAEGALDDAVDDFEAGMEDALEGADPDEGPLEPFDPEAVEQGDGQDPPPVEAPPATPEPAAPGSPEGPSDPPAPAEAAAVPGVPSAGSYAYDRTVTDEDGTRTEDASALVERLSGDDAAAQMRITLENDEGTIANDVAVDADGVIVQRSVLSSPLGSIDCDWNPDWMITGRYEAGTSWTYDSSCAGSSGTFTIGVDLSGSGTIVGTETITVGGTTYDAWVVDTVTTTVVTVNSPTVAGEATTVTTTRAWVDPATAMEVRSEATDSTTGDFGDSESSETRVLRSFTPA